jgi:hypothetical protein
MTIGPMAKNDSDDDPKNPIDDAWMYSGVLISIPYPGAEDYFPRCKVTG